MGVRLRADEPRRSGRASAQLDWTGPALGAVHIRHHVPAFAQPHHLLQILQTHDAHRQRHR